MAILKSKLIPFIALWTAMTLLAGCEFKFDPSKIWNWGTTETDTEYYQDKSDDLVETITRDVQEYETEVEIAKAVKAVVVPMI